jgi:hypothetical protein
VRAADAAGNVNVVLDTFTVDTAPPAVSITGQPANPTNNANPSFTVSAEEGATLACSLTPSGGTDAFTQCSSPQSYSGLADGAYTFKVQATDAAGNNSSASYAFTIDTLAPAVPTGLTATAASVSEIDLSWTAATDMAGYQVFRDGGTTPLGTVTSGTTFADTGLAPSSTHSYTVVAVDAAGNASAPSAAAVATTLTPPATATPTAPPATATSTALPAAATATLPAAPATATTPPTATSAVPTMGAPTPRAVLPTATVSLDARPRPTVTKTALLHPAGRPAKRSSTIAHKRSSKTQQQAQHVLGHQRHQVHHGRVGHQAAPHSTLAADLQQRIGAVLRHLDDALHQLLRIVGVRLSL